MQQPRYSVAQVIDQLNIGGAEQVLVMLANLLWKHGHAVSVITTVASGPLANKLHPEMNIVNLKRKWKWNPVTMYRLIKVLRRFDVVHVHSSYNLRYVFLASRLFALRKPVFYHEHYGDAVATKPDVLRRYIYKQTIFIAVAGKLATWAKDILCLPAQQVFILPNTILQNNHYKIQQKEKTLRLCAVGNILPNKNLLFTLQVLRALHTSGKDDTTLSIIGVITDKNYYQQLLSFISNNSLQDNVFFVTDCQDVQSILRGFTLAIHTAKSESGPLALIEYLAQGLPFVAYNTGEVAAQLQPQLPFFVMDDFDMDKWIAAIKKITTLPVAQLSAQLQRLYKEQFSPENYYNKCIFIYKAGLQQFYGKRKITVP